MKKKYDVAAYIWPAYTGDEPRARIFWPDGIGEWQTVKEYAEKSVDENRLRKPVWGYVNEADPNIMEMQINVAADYGVNVFIYDWYWYDGKPFLESCLNNGYLKARNNDKVQFYLMWANHNVNNTWDFRTSAYVDSTIWSGAVDLEDFKVLASRNIQRYFLHPSYYKIGGKPVFAIYDLGNIIKGFGGADNTIAAFNWFRKECAAAGFPGLHLQLVKWGEFNYNLSGVDGAAQATTRELAEQLGFDSMTHYQFVHFTDIDRDYAEILKDVKKEWINADTQYPIPYFPHVSVGWNNNPRFKIFRSGIVKNNSPEEFKKALIMAKEYVDNHPEQAPLITINSWNEWTETSYLEPDELNGYGYLEAIKEVFLADRDEI